MLLTALFQVATADIVRQAVSCYEMEYDIVPRLSVHSLNKLRERSGQLVGSYRVQVMMNLHVYFQLEKNGTVRVDDIFPQAAMLSKTLLRRLLNIDAPGLLMPLPDSPDDAIPGYIGEYETSGAAADQEEQEGPAGRTQYSIATQSPAPVPSYALLPPGRVHAISWDRASVGICDSAGILSHGNHRRPPCTKASRPSSQPSS